MDSSNHDNGDGGFYKGLFFGALLGIGLIWFLGTKEGSRVKKELVEKGEEVLARAKETVDEALSDNFVEDQQPSSEKPDKSAQSPQRFFEDG